MNFLAVDTSAGYLTVIAYKAGRREICHLPDCAMKHSVLLTDCMQSALRGAGLTPRECDFFAVVAGPGSFTGIRIGIATVKGLCFAAEKPALSVTSFDTLAYAERSGKRLALVDAGHGFFYACPYDGDKAGEAAYRSGEEVSRLIALGYAPVAAAELFGAKRVDPAEGLYEAVIAKSAVLLPARELSALYLRKSSAEEKR